MGILPKLYSVFIDFGVFCTLYSVFLNLYFFLHAFMFLKLLKFAKISTVFTESYLYFLLTVYLYFVHEFTFTAFEWVHMCYSVITFISLKICFLFYAFDLCQCRVGLIHIYLTYCGIVIPTFFKYRISVIYSRSKTTQHPVLIWYVCWHLFIPTTIFITLWLASIAFNRRATYLCQSFQNFNKISTIPSQLYIFLLFLSPINWIPEEFLVDDPVNIGPGQLRLSETDCWWLTQEKCLLISPETSWGLRKLCRSRKW